MSLGDEMSTRILCDEEPLTERLRALESAFKSPSNLPRLPMRPSVTSRRLVHGACRSVVPIQEIGVVTGVGQRCQELPRATYAYETS